MPPLVPLLTSLALARLTRRLLSRAQYTIVPTDSAATYLRLQLVSPSLVQRVYRELSATLIVGQARSKPRAGPSCLWPAGAAHSGWLAEAGRSSGQPAWGVVCR